MTHPVLGIAAIVILVGFIWFAFRQGLGVKPDRNNRDDPTRWGLGPWDGPS